MQKARFHSFLTSPRTWIVMALAAVVFRYIKPFPADFTSGDFTFWVHQWITKIQDNGFHTYALQFTNYSPAYTYLLGLISLLPEHLWLAAVKTLSIVFDCVAAGASWGIARIILPASDPRRRFAPALAAALVLWLPSLWLNSAVWAQCDSLWVGMCMLSLLCFLKDRPSLAMTCFAVGVSLKLQAVFFGPVVLLMLLSGRARWWQLLIIPSVYALLCVPCAVAGRSWESLWCVYATQYDFYPEWTMNAASICYVLRGFPYNATAAAAIVGVAIILTIWLTMKVWHRLRVAEGLAQRRIIVMFAAFCAVAVPWMLPMMHDRYMILGDVLTALCAAALAGRLRVWTAVLVELASTINIVWFLLDNGHKIFDGPTVRFTNVPPLIMVTVALYLMVKVYKQSNPSLAPNDPPR